MKKLTTEQIEAVSNYIKSFDIKWYELQVELTDHFVSIMEEIWSEDPELTFHQVKQKAEQRFGRNYFKEVEKQRTLVLRKEHNRSHLKIIGEYFKFPKIVLSFLMVALVYSISFYFEDLYLYNRILFGILLGISFLSLLNWDRYRNMNGKRFLSIDLAFWINFSAFSFSNWILILPTYLKVNYSEDKLFLLFLCCFFVLILLVAITGIHLTNKIVSNIKKQYQFT
jgi:hypothetical protein